LSEETARPSRPPVALAWARYRTFSIDMTDSRFHCVAFREIIRLATAPDDRIASY
jgi:hypothetical protein